MVVVGLLLSNFYFLFYKCKTNTSRKMYFYRYSSCLLHFLITHKYEFNQKLVSMIFIFCDRWVIIRVINSTKWSTNIGGKKINHGRKVKFLNNGTSCLQWLKFSHVPSEVEAYLKALDLSEAIEEDYDVLPQPANPTIAELKYNKYKKTCFFNNYQLYDVSKMRKDTSSIIST